MCLTHDLFTLCGYFFYFPSFLPLLPSILLPPSFPLFPSLSSLLLPCLSLTFPSPLFSPQNNPLLSFLRFHEEFVLRSNFDECRKHLQEFELSMDKVCHYPHPWSLLSISSPLTFCLPLLFCSCSLLLSLSVLCTTTWVPLVTHVGWSSLQAQWRLTCWSCAPLPLRGHTSSSCSRRPALERASNALVW